MDIYNASSSGHQSMETSTQRLELYVVRAKQLKCDTTQGLIHVMLGTIYKENGVYGKSEDAYEKGMKIRQRLNDFLGIASVHNNLITLYAQQKFPYGGLDHAEKALSQLAKVEGQTERVQSLRDQIYVNQGQCYRVLEDYQKAKEMYEKVDGNSLSYIIAVQGKGDISNDTKDYVSAIKYYQEAELTYKADSNIVSLAQLYRSIGLAHLGLKDTTQAVSYLYKSIEEAERSGNSLLSFDAWESLLEIQPPEIMDVYYEMLESAYLSETGSHKEKEKVLSGLAEENSRRGNYIVAYSLQKDAAHLSMDSSYIEKQRQEVTLREALRKEKRSKQQLRDVLLFVCILSFFMFLFYWLTRKKEREKNALRIEKEQIEQKYMKELLNIERTMRKQLSFQTHDIKTDAAAIRNQLEFAVNHLNTFPNTEELLQGIYVLSEKLLEQIRHVNKALHPSTGEWYKYLQTRLKALESSLSIETSIHTSQGFSQEISSELGDIIYRIVNVLIDNVQEHSGASKMEVKLLKTNGDINISVHDNGKGNFSYPMDEGTGLKSVRERVKSQGGTVKINTSQGTKIYINLPIKTTDK